MQALEKEYITPRDIKIALREGEITTADRYPPPPADWSEFQRKRLLRAYGLLDMYLKGHRTVVDIGKCCRPRQLRHQRVCQILQFAVRFLLETNYFKPGAGRSQAA